MTLTRMHLSIKVLLPLGMAACLVGAVFLVAKEPERKTASVAWSAKLRLHSLAEIPQRLNQPFDDRFNGQIDGKPTVIASCTDYLQSSKGFKLNNESESGVLRSYAVDCVALDMLRKAAPPRTDLMSTFRLTTGSISMLPPELAPAVSREQQTAASMAGAAGKSWAAVHPGATAKTTDKDQITVSQGRWQTKITEYARGDFNGDGMEDLLVRADYAATRGTYGNAKLFLLGRRRTGGRLHCEKEITAY